MSEWNVLMEGMRYHVHL